MPVNMLDSLQTHGLKPTRFLCPWDSPNKTIQEGSHSLLQGILLSRAQTQTFLHCRWILYHLSHQGSPIFIAILVIFIINEIIIFIYQIHYL